MRKLIKNQSGFTLVEVLIYSALLAMFIGAALAFITSILSTTDTLLERNETIANQDLVERKLYWILGRSTGITLPIANSSGTQLNVSGSDASIYPAIFALGNNQITLSLAGRASIPLTNARVKANQFFVENFSSSQSSSTLRISLTIASAIFSYIMSSTTLFHVAP